MGGMGIVYLARNKYSGNLVAIKVLMENLASNSEIAERFKREAEMMAHLTNDNIVRLIDFKHGTKLSLIMEYVEGRGLDTMIGQEVGPIPYERAVPLFLQVLSALSYAHSEGVIHRDIKPANILVSSDNKVKVTDFGIAKIVGQKGLTKTGVQMGTLYYSPPEQIKGKKTNQCCDIYALGMTLYEMLAGRLPFDDSEDTSEYQIMNRIINREKELDPREYYPYIPDWLVGILQKATAIDSQDRFQSCEEFAENVKMCMSDNVVAIDYWTKLASPSNTDDPDTEISDDIEQIVDDKVFCPYCTKFVMTDADICPYCNGALTSYCVGCGRLIPLNTDLCFGCKGEVSTESTARSIASPSIEILNKEFWLKLSLALIALLFLCIVTDDEFSIDTESVLVAISIIALLFAVHKTHEYTLAILLLMLGLTGAVFFSNFRNLTYSLQAVYSQSTNLYWIICLVLFVLNSVSICRPSRKEIRIGVIVFASVLLLLLVISFTDFEVYTRWDWDNLDELGISDFIVFPGYILIVIPLIRILFKSKNIQTNRKRMMGAQKWFLSSIYLLLSLSRFGELRGSDTILKVIEGLRDIAIPFVFLVIIGAGCVHFLLYLISPIDAMTEMK